MIHQFSRTELLLGKEGMERLKKARVAVFGIGGVGGHCVEALARSGIGEFDLIDNDEVALTNLNRQLVALHETIGRPKTEVMKERILSINPDAKVHVHSCFFLLENADTFPFDQYDYVVDAVDTVTAKIELVLKSQAAGVPVISSMGAGNKLDPTAFEVTDIYKTSVCPLAKVMRRELKKRGVKKLKVVYSKEEPRKLYLYDEEGNPIPAETKGTAGRCAPGSVSFVPSVAGLILAGEVVKDLAIGAKKSSFLP
ncbi:MAG: tRNA threonylcarbamoyladenosine dehydratase [Lachnospiraceae bacterium]|nr:tRNA threonylcarbamoyladenosine dehydratase [Lachnospiraceae bacterium]